MEEYQIVVNSQLGPREGRLRLERNGTDVTGVLVLLGWENTVSGQCKQETRLVLHHRLRTAVSELNCQTILELDRGRLKGAVCTERGHMELHGERIVLAPVEEEGERTHE